MTEFDKLWPGISAQTAALFMLVGAADLRGKPMSITEASDASGMTLAAASRNIQAFEQRRAEKDSDPLNLIEVRIHPSQYRAKLVTLTPRGKHLYNRIVQLMEA
ncbi:hypothetical protein [Rhizobium leguminosarum]|uniref:hypothetical protein n=1 Tax=Rhizobium leguminosarum TaxID=384 RepID=UPI0004853EAC|nr:hypothetical protein [Rhizobium leguminosarum]